MDEFSKNYDNVILLGDFNTWINDNAMMSCCSLNDLTSLIDQPTCYKNPDSSYDGCNRIKNGIPKTETSHCSLSWL